ncbi:MAG TPA: Maf family protein [Acidobacteriaceae bacterium]|jgi:septum formation protein|nr:Maf family protein [Acidobacteriaceae bacterium]
MMLILASASPRRRELLAQAGFSFTIESADVDESLRDGEDPTAYVLRLAIEKAQSVFARHSAKDVSKKTLIVLGADTTVVCDGEILAKPVDAADAIRMLRRLSGQTHQVLTGVAAVTHAGVFSAVDTTEVTFSEIPEADLAAYCATADPLDKAGAYGIQGYAARWIPRIDGDYFNVMGLPIARTAKLIEAALVEYNHRG